MSKDQVTMFPETALKKARGKVEQSLAKAISEEKDYACAGHPDYASQHEAYAVMLEELEETEINIKKLGKAVQEYWDAIKTNEASVIALKLPVIKEVAQSVALEAIQVAAVTLKAIDAFEEQNSK
ncbi:MAG: hypothetical protein FWF33_00565 [Clostridiales bacterium]|nr:hypothetical protein [Clostridiales bacterium]